MGNFIKDRARAGVRSVAYSQCAFALPQAFRQFFVEGFQMARLTANIGDLPA